jgi:NAD-dependent dihydropyrimidine dehydrogenase PreA subunit
MGRTRHPHVHIRNPQACTGCKKCVWACEHAAIEYIYVAKSSQSSRQYLPKQPIED